MASSLAKLNEKGKSKMKILEDKATSEYVSTHLYIKRVPSTQALDKEVILRRIRQRKRANKVRSVFQLWLGLPFSSKKRDKSCDQDLEDDAS
ncbi:unnamed protein product [Cochlearia groenlandica]